MQLTCKVDRHGRLMVPIEWRRKHGVDGEDQVLVREQRDGSLRLETRAQSIARAQQLVRKYAKVKPGESVVDEFIAERRAEAQREQG
jgi:bifunctional DNA-binding transcriptional regulator/antitoxin component of YhaV-PrlF toxin-antitoxin module